MVEDLTVRDVMTHDFIGVSESDSVRDAATVLLEDGTSVIAVIRGREPLGMVVERRLVAALLDGQDPDATRIEELMETDPPTIAPDERIDEAASILADANTSSVFVVERGELRGVLSENDVITAVTSLIATETNAPLTGPNGDTDRATDIVESESTMDSSQSVCEVCGGLKADLEVVNGRSVCTDCRSV